MAQPALSTPEHTHQLLARWPRAFRSRPPVRHSQFPYYTFVDREKMYTVGSLFYAIYFFVSFPMFYRMDEYPQKRCACVHAHVCMCACTAAAAIL